MVNKKLLLLVFASLSLFCSCEKEGDDGGKKDEITVVGAPETLKNIKGIKFAQPILSGFGYFMIIDSVSGQWFAAKSDSNKIDPAVSTATYYYERVDSVTAFIRSECTIPLSNTTYEVEVDMSFEDGSSTAGGHQITVINKSNGVSNTDVGYFDIYK